MKNKKVNGLFVLENRNPKTMDDMANKRMEQLYIQSILHRFIRKQNYNFTFTHTVFFVR